MHIKIQLLLLFVLIFNLNAQVIKETTSPDGWILQTKTGKVVPVLTGANNADCDVRMIWSGAPHNAFTDIIRYNNQFFCAFREGSAHIPGLTGTNGKIRVLVSADGDVWKSHALLGKNGYDLRDSKLSITPKGKLMMVMGGSVYNGKQLISRLPHISFFDDKKAAFSDPAPIKIDKKVQSDNDWLWSVNWNYKSKTAYGVLYQSINKSTTKAHLLKTKDGKKYRLVSTLGIDNMPTEATVTFNDKNEMLILLRCDQKDNNMGLLGKSVSPYEVWNWKNVGVRLGGPNIIPFENGKYIVGTRSFDNNNQPKTSLFIYDETPGNLNKMFDLPSGGDTSYPGMLIYDDHLWVSYYASHEGKAQIYLAKISLNKIKSHIK